MNRFKTDYEGGMPLWKKDFLFVDAARREALKGVVKSLIGANYDAAILDGCTAVDYWDDEDMLRITEGFVYFNNEIFYVPEHSMIKGGTYGLYFTEEVSFDPGGTKAFLNPPASHETWEVRRAKVGYFATPPAGGVAYPCATLINIMSERLGINQKWTGLALRAKAQELPAVGDVWPNAGGTTNLYGSLKYKRLGRTAHVAVSVYVDFLNAGLVAPQDLFIQLPSEMRASGGIEFSNVVANRSGGVNAIACRLHINGSDRLVLSNIMPASFGWGNYFFEGALTYELWAGSYSMEPSYPALIPGGASEGLLLLFSGAASGAEGESFALSGSPTGDLLVLVQGASVSEEFYSVVDGALFFSYQLGLNDYVMIYG